MYMTQEVGVHDTRAVMNSRFKNRGDRGIDILVSRYFARDGRSGITSCVSWAVGPSVMHMGLELCLCSWSGM